MAGASGCICVDGRLLAPHEASVSALDAGFMLGDGLFESLRASGGVPYLLERHLERLYGGAGELGFEGMPTRELLTEQIGATLARAGLDDTYLRITVTRGRGGAPPAPPSGSPTVVIAALPAPPVRDPAEGVHVALIGSPPQHGPKAKSTSRQSAVMARRRAERAGAAEGLYVSGHGRALEGTSSNVFAVCDGRLLTPPAEDCLPGVTRGRLLELARQDGLEALEAPLTVAQLLGAQEAFLSNAVQGLRSIQTIDGQPLVAQRGGAFDRLLSLYEDDRYRAANVLTRNSSTM
jgi:branched-chain amino acid aminotransferase